MLGVEDLTNFSLKKSITLPSLVYKYFNSLGYENDEPIYTYTDPFMRIFVRNSIKGGRCNVFNQHYESESNDEVFNIISRDLNDNGDIWDLPEKYFEPSNKNVILYAKEFDSKYEDYRDINQKQKTDYITINLTFYLFIKICQN